MGKVFIGWVVFGLALIASAETTLAWKFDTSGRTEVVPAKTEKAFTSSADMRWWTECSSTGIFRRGAFVIVR